VAAKIVAITFEQLLANASDASHVEGYLNNIGIARGSVARARGHRLVDNGIHGMLLAKGYLDLQQFFKPY
jgi:hypothetical protein